jgi:hypothetical protein
MAPIPTNPKAPCRLYVGTSGYSFAEWIDAGIYPPGIPAKDMLTYYSQRFNAIELNYTWYQMPKADAMQRMLSQVPDGFVFTAKLIRTITHEIDPKNWRAQHLNAAGKTGCIWLTCLMSWRPCLWLWSFAIGHGPMTRFFSSLKSAAWPWWPWMYRTCRICFPRRPLSPTRSCFMFGFMDAILPAGARV